MAADEFENMKKQFLELLDSTNDIFVHNATLSLPLFYDKDVLSRLEQRLNEGYKAIITCGKAVITGGPAVHPLLELCARGLSLGYNIRALVRNPYGILEYILFDSESAKPQAFLIWPPEVLR